MVSWGSRGGSRSAPQGSEAPVISLCSRLSLHVLSRPQDPWDGTSVSVRATPGTPSACSPRGSCPPFCLTSHPPSSFARMNTLGRAQRHKVGAVRDNVFGGLT